MFGGEIGASRTVGPLAVIADLQARFGGDEVEAAQVSVAAYSSHLSIGPWLAYRAFHFTIGPGVRVGFARLSGRSGEPELTGRSLSGLWLGPTAGLGANLRLSRWASLHSAVEAGYVLKPVRGLDEQARRLLALEGPWASAAIGGAVQW
jgi:hypothetical protein